MKKTLFLILFLTGLFPVFNDNALHLGCYQSYGQESTNGEEQVECDLNPTRRLVSEDEDSFNYENCETHYSDVIKDCLEECGPDIVFKPEDCAGVAGGSAYEDTCGCIGGTTGILDCGIADCAGVEGGFAYNDSCGCIGGTTGIDSCDDQSGCNTTCPNGYELDQFCNCNEVQQPCYNTCQEGYYQTLDCGCEPIPPPSCPTSCPSGYALVNCNCVQQTQPPSDNTNQIEKPLTQEEFNKLKTDNSNNYRISEKTNQIITTSDGVTHVGTLTIFKDKNVANHFSYYFTPNAGDGQFIAGGFYRIPDSQGNSSYTSYTSSSSGTTNTAPTPTWYYYDIDDFPSGQGYYIDQTTGTEISITISPNNTPATVINNPVTVCQGCYDWYLDNDGDGYEGGTQKSMTSPGAGWEQGASMGVDCNDNDASIKECNLPTAVSVTNIATCKCIEPPKKSNFSNVSFVYNALEGKPWIRFQGNCNESAKEQIRQSGLPNSEPDGAGSEINFFIDKTRQIQSGKVTPELNIQKGIDVIAKNLKAGKAVLAGVMYERYFGADKSPGGTLDDNNNVATNHYVAIVGMGIDNGKPYFAYIDNFVDSKNPDGTDRSLSILEIMGTSRLENKFYYYKDSVGNYYFSDKTAITIDGPTTDPNHSGHGFGNQYILTEIRDNH